MKETQNPEVEPVGRHEGYVRLDSITETGDEYEARMDMEQLADTLNGCKLTLKMVETLGDEHAYLVRGALPIEPSENGKVVTMLSASPTLSEFETFLDGCDRYFARNTRKKKTAMVEAKPKEDSDESDDLETFGNLQLRARAKRQAVTGNLSRARAPEEDDNSRVICVEDILPKVRSDD